MSIAGFRVIESYGMTDTVFTKKQARKFKNKRWVKKYLKNHSHQEPSTDFLVSETNKTIYAHPIMAQKLRSTI